MGTRNCDKSTQINIQPKDVLINNHPGITKLQEDLAQAKWTIEKLEEENVPQKKYQDLQQQLRNINASENIAFDKYQRVEEKVEEVKNRLKIVRSQMDIHCSLYTNVLACRSPTKNYALFLLERYLQLKIKAVKAGKPIELKIVDDFINCFKHHGVKFQRLICEFYLHNFILEEEMEKNPSPFVGDV